MIGEITEKSKYFQHNDYLDLTNGLVINRSTFPELYGTLKNSDVSKTELMQVVSNPTPEAYENFGGAVAIYGDTLVIGAKNDNTAAADAGSVYVYIKVNNTWELQQTINNPSPVLEDYFGSSVDIHKDTIIIGSYGDDTGGTNRVGAAFIYTRSGTTWTLQQEINNPTPVDIDHFSNSVSLYEDTVAIGALFEDTGASAAGSVYIYTRSGVTWTLQQEINNPSPVINDQFGYSVSLFRDTVAISANLKEVSAISDAGAAYVYTRTGGVWTLEQTIENPSPVASDRFGNSISLYEDTIAVGSTPLTANTEKIWVYSRIGTTWTLDKEIETPIPITDEIGFGKIVKVHQDTVIASGVWNDASGAVYIFSRDEGNWNYIDMFKNPTPNGSEGFAASLALYDDTILVGANQTDTSLLDVGSAYIYSIPLYDFSNNIEIQDIASNSTSVSIYGKYMVVGDSVFNSYQGNVKVYEDINGTWTIMQTITSNEFSSNNSFGAQVSMYNDTLAISEPGNDTDGADTGAIWVYTLVGSTWTLQQRIGNPPGPGSDNFSKQMALNKDTIVTGAYSEDTAGTDSGTAYIFKRTGATWALEGTINNPNPAMGDFFPSSVTIENDIVAFGHTYGETTALNNSGIAYVYTRSGATWTLGQTITSPSPVVSGGFGSSISISGDKLAIGRDEQVLSGEGKVYIYEYTEGTWSLQETLLNPVDTSSWWGDSVLINKNLLFCADPDSGATTTQAGSIYVYELINGAWTYIKVIHNPNVEAWSYMGRSIAYNNGTLVSSVDDHTLILKPENGNDIIPAKKTDNNTTKFFIEAK
jgi:hypothetical protein